MVDLTNDYNQDNYNRSNNRNYEKADFNTDFGQNEKIIKYKEHAKGRFLAGKNATAEDKKMSRAAAGMLLEGIKAAQEIHGKDPYTQENRTQFLKTAVDTATAKLKKESDKDPRYKNIKYAVEENAIAIVDTDISHSKPNPKYTTTKVAMADAYNAISDRDTKEQMEGEIRQCFGDDAMESIFRNQETHDIKDLQGFGTQKLLRVGFGQQDEHTDNLPSIDSDNLTRTNSDRNQTDLPTLNDNGREEDSPLDLNYQDSDEGDEDGSLDFNDQDSSDDENEDGPLDLNYQDSEKIIEDEGTPHPEEEQVAQTSGDRQPPKQQTEDIPSNYQRTTPKPTNAKAEAAKKTSKGAKTLKEAFTNIAETADEVSKQLRNGGTLNGLDAARYASETVKNVSVIGAKVAKNVEDASNKQLNNFSKNSKAIAGEIGKATEEDRVTNIDDETKEALKHILNRIDTTEEQVSKAIQDKNAVTERYKKTDERVEKIERFGDEETPEPEVDATDIFDEEQKSDEEEKGQEDQSEQVKEIIADINNRLDKIDTTVKQIREDIDEINDKIDETNQRIDALEEKHHSSKNRESEDEEERLREREKQEKVDNINAKNTSNHEETNREKIPIAQPTNDEEQVALEAARKATQLGITSIEITPLDGNGTKEYEFETTDATTTIRSKDGKEKLTGNYDKNARAEELPHKTKTVNTIEDDDLTIIGIEQYETNKTTMERLNQNNERTTNKAELSERKKTTQNSQQTAVGQITQ